MQKSDLEQYQVLKLEAEALEERIIKLQNQQPRVEYGAVKGSHHDFPYTPATFKVSGYSIIDDEKRRLRIEQLQAKLDSKRLELMDRIVDIEDFITTVPDGTMRLILRYKYIDGMSQEQIGRKIHLDRSRVSRKIDEYFMKNAHKAQK